jgi:hypothetical protein
MWERKRIGAFWLDASKASELRDDLNMMHDNDTPGK